MELYTDRELLDASLKQLVAVDNSDRNIAAIDVRVHVEAAAKELSFERFGLFELELYQVRSFSL